MLYDNIPYTKYQIFHTLLLYSLKYRSSTGRVLVLVQFDLEVAVPMLIGICHKFSRLIGRNDKARLISDRLYQSGLPF